MFIVLLFFVQDYEALQRGIFGNLQKVLNQPHGLSTGDQVKCFSDKMKWEIYFLSCLINCRGGVIMLTDI